MVHNRIYLTDNTGVISFYFLTPKFQPCLVTHRSIMRSVVVDDITMAVADKYGNLIILRSMFDVMIIKAFHVDS